MTAPRPSPRDWGSTLRIRADILMTGGRTVVGDMHLQPLASFHSGPEIPEDMLNRSDAFFPVTGDDGHTVLLAKAQVLAIGVAPGLLLLDEDRVSAARSTGLKIEFSDSSVLSGTVTIEPPPGRPRALDFLNDRPGFFALRLPDSVQYVNRAHVRVVTPLD